MIHHRATIHSKAHVDRDTVRLGAGTKIWQFASITRGTIMGEDCNVSPFAMLDGSIYGDGVIISGGVMAGAGFKVGNGVFIGPNVVLCNDRWPFADKQGYRDDLLRDGKHFAVVIEDGAAIGAGAVILPGVRIGRGAMVGAGATVGHDLLPGCIFPPKEGGKGLVLPTWAGNRHRWVEC